VAGRLDDAERVEVETPAQWRAWLEANHAASPGVWVVQYRRGSGRQGLGYEDLVCEALCFGWVDGTFRRLDDERTILYVAPRRRGGTWARSNKERVERLAAAGRMAPAGLAAVAAAKADGSWSALDAVDALELPDDLAAALAGDAEARTGYEAMSASAKRQLLWSVLSAKRAETRERRVRAVVEAARAATVPRLPPGARAE
jgi:uncharacterized protein YdeI (YjbR/CyaY-like superfamily)